MNYCLNCHAPMGSLPFCSECNDREAARAAARSRRIEKLRVALAAEIFAANLRAMRERVEAEENARLRRMFDAAELAAIAAPNCKIRLVAPGVFANVAEGR